MTLSIAPGTRLGPYEIVGLIGAGGMGEVYRARDPRLRRDVAVKVLPEAFARSPERLRRFAQEARAAGALTHPNVLTVFDVGSQDGTHYLVSELLDGETLQERLRRGEPIGVAEGLTLIVEVAKGAASAHEAGVLHRDLKPANVFVTRDGRVKILDFGVAKLLQPDQAGAEGATATTNAGGPVGTAAYMSPEQIRDEPLDGRSDVFAMGAILYELVTGRTPFTGSSASDVMAAILRDEPPPPSSVAPAVPAAVDAVVRRCLAKRREDRFETARELAAALETLLIAGPSLRPPLAAARPHRRTLAASAAVGIIALASLLGWRTASTRDATVSPHPRIVVLPFEGLGGAQDQSLAAGLTEEVITRLTSLKALTVIARPTAFGYDRAGKTVQAIGSDLAVDYILEGTVQSSPPETGEPRVRIQARLIQVADERHVWADRYDRVLADFFAVQSDVARKVVAAMDVALLPRERTALERFSTKDQVALDFFLKGMDAAGRGNSKEEHEAALAMFEAAVDRDPAFTQALAHLAMIHSSIYFYHWDRAAAHLDKAREVVERLTRMAPDDAETYMARGYYRYWGLGEYAGALTDLNEALGRQPGNTDALLGVSYVLRRQGRWDESAAESAKLLKMDPRNSLALIQHGQTCVLLRRYEDADRALGMAASLNPRLANAWAFQARVHLLWRGDVDKAARLVEEGSAVPGVNDSAGLLAFEAFRIALMRRDYSAALRILDGGQRDAFFSQWSYLPLDLLRGDVHRVSGDDARARTAFAESRRALEALIEADPEDSRYHSALAVTCAGLGLREKALESARRGVDLMPIEKDAWRAVWRLQDEALVLTMLGDHARAIERLDFLLERTGDFSPHLVRLDPRWSPLASHPRFANLARLYR